MSVRGGRIWQAAVVGWLAGQTPEALQVHIDMGVDAVADALLGEFGGGMRLAVALMGRSGMQSLRDATERDFSALIGQVMLRNCEAGLILQANRHWFIAAMASFRDRFLTLAARR